LQSRNGVGSILFYSVFHQQTPEMDKATNHNFPDPTLFNDPKMIKKSQQVFSIQVCSQNFINFHASLSISEKINIGLRKQSKWHIWKDLSSEKQRLSLIEQIIRYILVVFKQFLTAVIFSIISEPSEAFRKGNSHQKYSNTQSYDIIVM